MKEDKLRNSDPKRASDRQQEKNKKLRFNSILKTPHKLCEDRHNHCLYASASTFEQGTFLLIQQGPNPVSHPQNYLQINIKLSLVKDHIFPIQP
jgi:hypothetical protein